ncbi:sodium:calcium antiporter [Lutibaculum baratangense]|uniref:Sodium/calcium exchanger membrane region domain-containing protein n=1 Tax=Lutibaculum baratangense AMV1 TaxID=631454 RepID=V4QTS4_9HYPH|nr:hypothetical protein [Lutibaculum baratangense]ESR23172.1 hypothetical protein N177_3240 [Lutibaculum baratangense AMV1]
MLLLIDLPVAATVAIFLAAAALVTFAGTRLSPVADELADHTGLGEVVAGALFVGISTSLPGILTSVLTAAADYPSLSIGNALGSLTAQTMFLAIADMAYRRANLEHAAATVTGLAQGVLFMALLCVPLFAASFPLPVLGIDVATLVMIGGYALGLRLLTGIKKEPMWVPVETSETAEEESEPDESGSSAKECWKRFFLYSGLTAAGGYFIAVSGVALVRQSGMSETAVGTIFTGVATSLPELVTAVMAVRIGAVSLAVGDVLGGNAFDVLFLGVADLFYGGSIYAEFSAQDRSTALIAQTMTGIIILGMLRRERNGPGGIGFESVIVLGLYAVSVAVVAF